MPRNEKRLAEIQESLSGFFEIRQDPNRGWVYPSQKQPPVEGQIVIIDSQRNPSGVYPARYRAGEFWILDKQVPFPPLEEPISLYSRREETGQLWSSKDGRWVATRIEVPIQ